jgi:hypothetical protein
MVNRVDGVILSVGVVVLVASVIGVVLYDEEAPSTYTVGWAESDAQELESMSDSGGVGEYTFTTNLNQSAVSNVTFAVEVSFDGVNVNDDTITVEVEGPAGTGDCEFTLAGQQDSGSGSCEAAVTVNERPEGLSVTAMNDTEAKRDAVEQANLTSATGEWTTTVTISSDGEVQDPSYEVTVTPSFTTWDATISPTGGTGRAG